MSINDVAERLTYVEHRLVRAEAEILRLGEKALATDYMRQFPEPYIPGDPVQDASLESRTSEPR